MANKYLNDGTEVVVEREIDGGAIVTPIYIVTAQVSSYDDFHEVDAESYGKSYFVESADLFDKPPTAKLHESIKTLNEDIEKRRAVFNDLRIKEADLSRKISSYENSLRSIGSRHELLEGLEAYFDNKVTHVLVFDRMGIPSIIEAGERESRCGNDVRERKLRLITLEGSITRSDEDIGWVMNHYSDGSADNSHTKCQPCISRDQAIERGAEYIKSKVMHKGRFNSHRGYISGLAKACKVFGVTPDQWVVDHTEAEKADYANRRKQQLEKRAKLLRKELSEAEAELQREQQETAA